MSDIGLLPKGAFLVGTGSGNVVLPAGPNDEVITADSTQPSGVKWAPAGGTPSDDLSIGALVYFSTNNGDAYLSPKYLKCNAQIVSQATYPTLFNRVGLLNPPASSWTTNTTGTPTFTYRSGQEVVL